MSIDDQLDELFRIRKVLIKKKASFEVRLDMAVIKKVINKQEKNQKHEIFMEKYMNKRVYYDNKWLRLHDKKRALMSK